MKWIGIACAVIVASFVLYKIGYPTQTYRYRMTVNVEVDGQMRSGSSVIEARVTKQPMFLPGVNPLEYSERGEAVFVDLGGQRNIVALLASGSYAEGAAYPSFVVPQPFKLNLFEDSQLASLPQLRGRWDLTNKDLPTLITFSNPGDSATAEVLRVDQLEQFFGPGVRWRGIVVEMTTDAVTHVIESKLPWVTKLTSGLSGSSILLTPGKFTLNGPYLKR
jgi:hypothetical protein